MDLVIQERNIQLTAQARDYIEKKMASLDRKLQRPASARLELTQEPTKALKDRVVAQVTLDCNGTIIRAEERAADLMTAVDAVHHVLSRRVNRFKSRLQRKGYYRKRPQPTIRDPQPSEESVVSLEAETAGGSVVRVKRFAVKPLSVEEAIERMELVGHDFFLFLDSDSGHFCVLYRRKDGNYGVIVPDIP